MSTEHEPVTPSEARAYEAKTRRELWIGLAILVTVVVLVIIAVMEARFRGGLDDPRPSAALDDTMQGVIDQLGPLPGDAREIVLTTRGERPARYEVVVRDGDGERLFELARGARTAGLIEHGARAGEPVNFRVELSIDRDGNLQGSYRPDRGVPVERYQQIASGVLRDTFIAWHAHVSHPVPEVEEQTSEVIHAGWDRVMD